LKSAKRSFIRIILPLAMIVALPGMALSSIGDSWNSLSLPPFHSTSSTGEIEKTIATIGDWVVNSKSSVWETGEADGAGIPGKADAKVDKSSSTESIALFFVGVGVIFIAILGRRTFQKKHN